MVSSAEELTSNLQALLSIHKKAIDVLKTAKNKNNTEIGKIVGIAPTTVSTILNRAKRYSYVDKIGNNWIKTKEIKGVDLYKMAKVKFTKELKAPNTSSSGGTKTKNPLAPLIYFKEATEMMDSYRCIFCLENTIRDFMRKIFENEKDWMKNRIDKAILKDIEKAKSEPYYAHKKRKDDLEYATLGHLFQIIISGKNWKDFLPKLKEKNKGDFISIFKRVLSSRNSTAHCVPLSKSDRGLVESRVKEITLMFDFS